MSEKKKAAQELLSLVDEHKTSLPDGLYKDLAEKIHTLYKEEKNYSLYSVTYTLYKLTPDLDDMYMSNIASEEYEDVINEFIDYLDKTDPCFYSVEASS